MRSILYTYMSLKSLTCIHFVLFCHKDLTASWTLEKIPIHPDSLDSRLQGHVPVDVGAILHPLELQSTFLMFSKMQVAREPAIESAQNCPNLYNQYANIIYVQENMFWMSTAFEHVVSTHRRTHTAHSILCLQHCFLHFLQDHASQNGQPKKISVPWNFIQLLFSETSNLWNFNPRTGWRIITCKDLTFFKNWLGRIDLKPLDFICLISLYKPSGVV